MSAYGCETLLFFKGFNSRNYYDGAIGEKKNQPIYWKKKNYSMQLQRVRPERFSWEDRKQDWKRIENGYYKKEGPLWLNWSPHELSDQFMELLFWKECLLIFIAWTENLVADEFEIRPVLIHGLRSLLNVSILERKFVFFFDGNFVQRKRVIFHSSWADN